MTNQQILTKAIQKAIDGGWQVDLEAVLPEMSKKWSLYGLQYTGYSGLLYSKDFAKALWGDWNMVETGKLYNSDGTLDSEQTITAFSGKAWQYHLQQMVIADDPIKYLGEHL